MLYFALQALYIITTKVKIDYYNPKYVKFANISVRKINRHSPYSYNFDIDLLIGVGNNVTVGRIIYIVAVVA